MSLIMFHTRDRMGRGKKNEEKSVFLVHVKAEFFCYTIVTDDLPNLLIFPSAIAFYD